MTVDGLRLVPTAQMLVDSRQAGSVERGVEQYSGHRQELSGGVW